MSISEHSASALTSFKAPFFSPLPNPEKMAFWDHSAQELGIAGIVLMETAARAAVEKVLAYAPISKETAIAIAVGSGNNGGDAICMGRILTDLGYRVTLYLRYEEAAMRADCLKEYEIAKKLGIQTAPLAFLVQSPPDLLIDGLLGTGFHGPLEDDLLHDIRAINRLHIPYVVAVDIPSGLNGTTGRPSPEAIHAHLTISMQATKVGLTMPQAASYTGTIVCVPVGIPAKILAENPPQAFLLEEALATTHVPLPHNAYKTRFGRVGIVGGGVPDHTGAAHLAARASLRAGAGLVRVLAPDACCRDIRLGLPEIMLTALGSECTNTWPTSLSDELVTHIQRLSCLVVGPGLGLGPDADAFVSQLIASPLRPPLVLDADALTLIAHHPQLLEALRPNDVLTPHPGEAASLLGTTSTTVQKDRQKAILELAKLQKGVVVLKGAASLITQHNGPLLISPWDIPQLAVGGAGDVLAGLVGALIAQRQLLIALARDRTRASKISPEAALFARLISQETGPMVLAARAVSLHALAARDLATLYPNRGFLAQELADRLPHVTDTEQHP